MMDKGNKYYQIMMHKVVPNKSNEIKSQIAKNLK